MAYDHMTTEALKNMSQEIHKELKKRFHKNFKKEDWPEHVVGVSRIELIRFYRETTKRSIEECFWAADAFFGGSSNELP